MLKIGDFSKLARISIRMLRYYDENGLLQPKTIDRFTGYRYYGEDQLPQAERIRALREMGFTGEIEVDGGVNLENAPALAAAGADTLVMGTAFFHAVDPARVAREVHALGHQA